LRHFVFVLCGAQLLLVRRRLGNSAGISFYHRQILPNESVHFIFMDYELILTCPPLSRKTGFVPMNAADEPKRRNGLEQFAN
jgi:hypothetical protein